MPDRYEILAALVDANADALGDQAGYHHVVVGILRDLHDWEAGRYSSDEDLANAVYDRIAAREVVQSFENGEDQAGVSAPDTGTYGVGAAYPSAS